MSQPYDQPLFGDADEAPTVRKLTAKDKDDALHKVTWRRYRGTSRPCDDCFMGGRGLVKPKPSVWVREQAKVEAFLCYDHKALRLETESLRGS